MTKKTRSKGFFALDVHQFEGIRQNGLGVEEAATYLSLLKSTDQGNVVSSGGIRSVMNYSGLSRAEVKRAIRNLECRGLIECLEVERERARKAERYNLPIYDSRRSLSLKERGIVDAIEAEQQPAANSDIQAAHRAASKGWVEKLSDGWHIVKHSNTVAFIPNSFVQVSEGQSPLYRLVNVGELGPIMLAAELYQLQNLMDERGVPLDVVRGYFHAENEERCHNHRIHHLYPGRQHKNDETGQTESFATAHRRRWWSGEGFWDNLRALDAAHVTEWAVYSANGKTPEHDEYAYNRPQTPLGVLRNGRQVLKTPESRPAFMAYLVARLHEADGQITESLPQLIEEWRTASPVIAFENASVSHVEGVSILRLTHRAATENAKVWYHDLCQECDKAFFFVETVARSYFPQVSGIVQEIQNTPDFKEAISMKINECSMAVQ
ncbi:hypothetical protein DDZ14_04330 [Maritimibacter sp. 55A14]|uniref:hypothetical protein n=1 Tax=Maritimibacter sp. 55A14 TaxID=2174844 RepID=UPI000D60CAA4|nr:hypothetical protein [Maritimibacter sp. 55A14]PWE33434.1 hypothetical protein DDZ14_04330 [Maritimibacter sp. 55A14]